MFGCVNWIPLYVPSTQPNSLQCRQPGQWHNINRTLVCTTKLIIDKHENDGEMGSTYLTLRHQLNQQTVIRFNKLLWNNLQIMEREQYETHYQTSHHDG